MQDILKTFGPETTRFALLLLTQELNPERFAALPFEQQVAVAARDAQLDAKGLIHVAAEMEAYFADWRKHHGARRRVVDIAQWADSRWHKAGGDC